jgi:hypothetical protein
MHLRERAGHLIGRLMDARDYHSMGDNYDDLASK